jgi:N-acetyl-alpha-D-muramate 1-phosphate uridylyltransferase
VLTIAILAGGRATRLGRLTENLPKSLLELNGEPFIVHQLRLLRASGICQAVLCVGHLGELIECTIGNGGTLGLQVDYSFDGPELLGTAGAIKNALPKLGDSFFVVYGDSYLPCDYSAIERAFESSKKPGMMTVFRNEGKWDLSNVEYDRGEILDYSKAHRTPRMKHIDYGLGVFHAEAFANIASGKACDLTEVYTRLLRHKQLAAFEVQERFYEIGSPTGLRETAEFLATRPVILNKQ